MQFANGCMLDCMGGRRSQTVPIMMASPRYMAKRTPYTTASRRLLIQDRWSNIQIVVIILLPNASFSLSVRLPPPELILRLVASANAAGDDVQEF